MLRVKAFQGLRPAPTLVQEIACVPYDVVSREESAELAAGKPNSLLHVDRAEIDLPGEPDSYADAVYAKAKENFLALQESGALIEETEPCVYLYQQRMGSHVQVGVALVCHVEDYESGTIKQHEKTRLDKENDRTRLIDTISADTGPVFLTYRDSERIDALVVKGQHGWPLYEFTAPDGVQHTVWKVAGGQELIEGFRDVPVSYVADGHHRTASAARVSRERRAANPDHTGNEEYNWFLAVLFPASQLQILPYNRVVKDLNGLNKEAFLEAVGRVFTLTPGESATPSHPGEVQMYLDGSWYQLAWHPDPHADPISQLDISALQERVLAPILGIDDPRTSKRVDFVGGIRGTNALTKLVDTGNAAVAFSLYPTTVEQLMAIADTDQMMPPKSTWFEPKLRSGLFIHTFEEAAEK